MVMYENILEDAQEIKRRLSIIGEKVDETVICELLHSFGPNYEMDHIINMITENWDSRFQNALDKAGPSVMNPQCDTKDTKSTQKCINDKTCVEISDDSTDSSENRDDYYTITNWDDVSSMDSISQVSPSPSPVELSGDTSSPHNNNEVIIVHSDEECLEENNNDPNNNLDSLESHEELQNNSPDINIEAREPSVESFKDSTPVNFEDPKPGCSKDPQDRFPWFKNQIKLYNEVERIHAVLPKFKHNVIYKTLYKNQHAENRVELTIWDLLPQERPKAQIPSKRKFSDDTCFVQRKKSVSDTFVNNSATVTKKCLTYRKKAPFKNDMQVCAKNETDTLHCDKTESVSLIDETDKIKKNVTENITVSCNADDNNDQEIADLTKPNENIDINTDVNMYDLEKSQTSENNSMNDEKQPIIKIGINDIHCTTMQNTILRPPKLTLNSNILTYRLQSLSGPILAPAKLKYIGRQLISTKSSETSGQNNWEKDKQKQNSDKHTALHLFLNKENKGISDKNIVDAENSATITQNQIALNTETKRSKSVENIAMNNLQSNDTTGMPESSVSKEVNSGENENQNKNNLTDKQNDISDLQSSKDELQKIHPSLNMETVATNSNIETDATNSNMETDATNTNFVEPAKLSNPSQLVTEQDHEQPGPSGILHETHKSIVVSDSAPKYQPQVQASTSNDFSNTGIKDKQANAANDDDQIKLLNQSILKTYYKLIPIFPDVDTNYIKKICNNYTRYDVSMDETVLLQTLVEYLLEHGHKYPHNRKVDLIEVSDKYDLNEQYDNLLEIFPEADPGYLRNIAEEIYNDPDKLKEFVQSKLENPDYPTKEQYLNKKKITEQQKQYTINFQIQHFLEIFPDPFSYFEDVKRECRRNSHALEFLKHYFNKFKMNTLSDVYRAHKFNLSLTAKFLERSNPDMKTKRNYRIAQTDDIPLLQEIAFIQHKLQLTKYLAEAKQKEDKEFEELKSRNELIECQCCYDNECMPSKCSTCSDGHIFCNSCIVRNTDIKLADGETHINCLLDCGSAFNLTVLQQILPPTKFSILLRKRQEAEVIAAGLEGLVSCPFCHFASIPPPEDKVFKCLNPDCMKESCRFCKEINHIPLKCGETKSDAARLYLEEKMTEALLRKCYKCTRTFFKEEGCNKMTCFCGAMMCYICDQPVKNYGHFSGQGSLASNLCPLWSDDRRMNAEGVIKVYEETMKHIKEKNPNIDLNTKALLPKLPARSTGPHQDIAHANTLPAHANRIVINKIP